MIIDTVNEVTLKAGNIIVLGGNVYHEEIYNTVAGGIVAIILF
jgi:hypothetical protein